MTKFAAAFSAAPHSTREQCRAHYRDNHGKLVPSVADFWRHVGCYIQNEVLDEFGAFAVDPPLLGVTEITYGGMEAFERSYEEPAYEREIVPDEMRFADRATPFLGVYEEVEAIGGERSPAYKTFRLVLPPPGRTDAAIPDWFASAGADTGSIRSSGGYRRNRLVAPASELFDPSCRTLLHYEEFWSDSLAEATDIHRQLAESRTKAADDAFRIVDVVALSRPVTAASKAG